EARDLHDRVNGPDVAKELPVDGGDCLPVLDTGKKNARTHNVLQTGPRPLERGRDDLQTTPRLRARIAAADRLSVPPERGRAGDGYDGSRAHRARDTYLGLIGTAARDQSAHDSAPSSLRDRRGGSVANLSENQARAAVAGRFYVGQVRRVSRLLGLYRE